MLAGKIDPKGIIYLGDGAGGVNLREPDKNPRPYMAKTASIRHFYLVTLYPGGRDVLAINDKGQVFDEVYQASK